MNIIAEVGSNWKGIGHALDMITHLSNLRIKLIKFQLFTKDQVKDLPEYIPKVIDEDMAKKLFEWGVHKGVNVFFSVCYPEAIPMCERIGVKYYKVRYVDRNNQEIICKVANTGKPWFRSGSGDDSFTSNTKVINLFCVPKYPARYADYFPLSNKFGGVSDHTPDLSLFENNSFRYEYWEMHVKEDDNCLESKWSKKIGDIKSVLV